MRWNMDMAATASLCAVTIVLSPLICGCGLWQQISSGRNGQDGDGTSDKIGAPPLLVTRVVPNAGAISDQMSPQQAVDTLRSNMKPMPDKRFLGAIAMIHNIITREKVTPITVTFDSGMWNITYAGLQAGKIREFADTEDFLSLLGAWYKRLASSHNFKIDSSADSRADSGGSAGSRASSADSSTSSAGSRAGSNPRSGDYPEIRKLIREYTPKSLVMALALANEKWSAGDRSSSLVAASAEASTGLVFLSLDRVQLYDTLSSRAMTLLAISESADGKPRFRERCLLSTVMRYEAAANKQGLMLDKSDPVRLMIEKNSEQLQLVAHPAEAPPQSKICNLLLLARTRQAERWRSEAAAWLTQTDGAALPILKAFEDLVPYNNFVAWGSYLVGTTLHEIEGKNTQSKALNIQDLFLIDETAQRSTTWFANDIILRLDSGLSKIASVGTGPFIDEECVAGFYRGYFYTGIRYLREGENLEKLADVMYQSKDRLTKCMGYFFKEFSNATFRARSSFSSTFNSEFNSVSTQTDRDSNRMATPSFFEDRDKVNMLPAPFYFEFLLLGTGRRFKYYGMRWLFERVDARPESIYTLSQIATNDNDIALANRLIEASYQLGWTRHIAQPYIETLSDPRMTIDGRMNLLKSLRAKGVVSTKQIEAICKKMVEQNPTDWASVEPLATVYYDQNRSQEAKQLVLDWLKKNQNRQHSDETLAKTVLGYFLLNEGKPQEALVALGDKASTGRFECIRLKALILEKLGRFSEAEEWAKEAVKRYPGLNYPVDLLLTMYWRNGRYSEAADMIAGVGPRHRSHGRPHSGLHGTNVGQCFADALVKKPQEIPKATEVLLARGITGWRTLGEIAQAVSAMGDHEKAFELFMQCQVPPQGETDRLLSAYKQLKLARGEKPARDWLVRQVAPADRMIIMRDAYLRRCFELLWTMEPSDAAKNDQLWLLRAAAFVDSEQKQKDLAKRKMLAARFEKKGTSFEHEVGRYLMDEKGGEDLLKKPLNLVQLCVCSYYIGLHDLNAHPSYGATDWFRLTKETGLGMYESHLSSRKLDDVIDQTCELELGIAFSLPRARPVYDKDGEPIYFAFSPNGRLR